MKKGFTLLELLAVIVVLAIIALIVTPFVTKAINTAKKGAFADSMYNLVKSAELYTTKKMANDDFSETILHSINGIESNGLDFKYKGKSLKDVYLEINEKGKTRLLVWDDGFCARKDFEEQEVTVTETEEGDCSLNRISVPILTGGSLEWAPERTISVQTTPELNGLALHHYQYYISTSNDATDLNGGEWIDLEPGVSSIKINTDGEYYIFMRGVDTTNKNGLTSAGAPIKIDNREFTITVTPPTNGTVSVNGEILKAKVGTSINVTAIPATGFSLISLSYNDSDITSSGSFTMPRGEVVIRSEFSKTPYELSWDETVTGGSITVKVNDVVKTSPATVVMGDTVTITPTPGTGYNLNTLTYNGNNIKTTKSFTVGTSDVAIAATWSKITYAVTYNANSGTSAPAAQTKTYGVTLALTTTKPTRTSYVFVNWNTKADGTGTAYASGANYTGNAAVTLYAQWRIQRVYFLQNGAVKTGYVGWGANCYNHGSGEVGTGADKGSGANYLKAYNGYACQYTFNVANVNTLYIEHTGRPVRIATSSPGSPPHGCCAGESSSTHSFNVSGYTGNITLWFSNNNGTTDFTNIYGE